MGTAFNPTSSRQTPALEMDPQKLAQVSPASVDEKVAKVRATPHKKVMADIVDRDATGQSCESRGSESGMKVTIAVTAGSEERCEKHRLTQLTHMFLSFCFV